MNIIIIIIIIIIANINIIITTFVRTITFKLSVMQHTEGPADGRGVQIACLLHRRRRLKQI